MKLHTDTLELVGRTPLVKLRAGQTGHAGAIYAKLEKFNPIGSVKDRIAHAMVEDAETRGVLAPGGTLVEPTSGNTGIALAMVGAVKGYRVILTMPETMSIERRRLLIGLGAELVLTPGTGGMRAAIDEADRIAQTVDGAVVLGQFDNPANPRVHEQTTGPEILEATGGEVDIVIAGIGTGGTISGVGKYLRQDKLGVAMIGVEPTGSPFLSKGKAGPHKIQGIGAGFKPKVLDMSVVTEVIRVSDADAAKWMRHLARVEGIFSGISSGAALGAALEVAARPASKDAVIVVILPDGGEKYLSNPMWQEANDD